MDHHHTLNSGLVFNPYHPRVDGEYYSSLPSQTRSRQDSILQEVIVNTRLRQRIPPQAVRRAVNRVTGTTMLAPPVIAMATVSISCCSNFNVHSYEAALLAVLPSPFTLPHLGPHGKQGNDLTSCFGGGPTYCSKDESMGVIHSEENGSNNHVHWANGPSTSQANTSGLQLVQPTTDYQWIDPRPLYNFGGPSTHGLNIEGTIGGQASEGRFRVALAYERG